MNIADKIRSAGVVGAGGAGFPAHVKAASRVDTVISNGSECEPLIHKDYELMVHNADSGIIGVKNAGAAAVGEKGLLVNKVVIPSPRRESLSEII